MPLAPTDDEAERLQHELEVHAIELELQNEELRRSQLELTVARDRYQTLFDSCPVAYVTFDRAGLMLEANAAAAALFGVEVEDLLGRELSSLLDRSQADALYLHLRELEDRPSLPPLELRLTRSVGALRWIELRVLGPTTEQDPAPWRAALVDVTLQRSLWQAEEERAEQMQGQVEALRHELRVGDRLAAVGSVAATVAHELNNPLGYLLLSAEEAGCALARLEEELGSPSANVDVLRTLLAAVQDGADRACAIAADLLLFARDSGEEWTDVDAVHAVEAALRMVRKAIEPGVRLELDLRPVPLVRANEGRLVQVFINLLSNAGRALREATRPPVLGIRTRSSGEDVVIEVWDTGCGLGAGTKERVFDPFFTNRNGGGGTGIGLAVCHRVVTELGGTIEPHDMPQGGARFVITLPSVPGSDEPVQAPTPPPAEPTPAGPRGGRRPRVLIVDDEREIVRSIQRVLRSSYEVAVAFSGNQARALLEVDADFDAVLCDATMPDGSGADLVAWLQGANPTLLERLLLVTGGGVTVSDRRFIAANRERVLLKPLEREVLLARLASVVGGEVAAPPPP